MIVPKQNINNNNNNNNNDNNHNNTNNNNNNNNNKIMVRITKKDLAKQRLYKKFMDSLNSFEWIRQKYPVESDYEFEKMVSFFFCKQITCPRFLKGPLRQYEQDNQLSHIDDGKQASYRKGSTKREWHKYRNTIYGDFRLLRRSNRLIKK
jgi:hypothetical protein